MGSQESWFWRNLVPILAMGGGVVLGPVLALWVLPAEWGVGLKVAWGVLGGAGCGFIVTANRILGAYGSGEW